MWPKYENPETTSAKLYGPTGDAGDGYSPMNGRWLVNPTMAKSVLDEINKALNLTGTMSYPPDPWPWKVVWGSETRRNINFEFGSEVMNAATVLEERFKNGIGSPGQWVKGSSGQPQFVPDNPPTGEADLRPEIPMVVRPLLPNERVDCNPFGCVVTRTDLTTNEPAPGTGSLTVAQDARLKTIESDVKTILGKMS